MFNPQNEEKEKEKCQQNRRERKVRNRRTISNIVGSIAR
jgi:hypothetical protein